MAPNYLPNIPCYRISHVWHFMQKMCITHEWNYNFVHLSGFKLIILLDFQDVPAQSTQFEVDGLEFEESYSFRVIQSNKAGNSPPSEHTSLIFLQHEGM